MYQQYKEEVFEKDKYTNFNKVRISDSTTLNLNREKPINIENIENIGYIENTESSKNSKYYETLIVEIAFTEYEQFYGIIPFEIKNNNKYDKSKEEYIMDDTLPIIPYIDNVYTKEYVKELIINKKLLIGSNAHFYHKNILHILDDKDSEFIREYFIDNRKSHEYRVFRNCLV